ncbi:hypothetical protein BS47DRAFT_1364744 [Hydnum rufescens UP504]|uniref:Uncharacterized protein n=1 Tax=Hydnum rufescens UP504 TaxID=1448309 RepID=A0A9P6DT54_9AGAM|nr:hypothetical protein BS47DRAFT_1364744 [Hydnum rufescens UP504]
MYRLERQATTTHPQWRVCGHKEPHTRCGGCVALYMILNASPNQPANPRVANPRVHHQQDHSTKPRPEEQENQDHTPAAAVKISKWQHANEDTTHLYTPNEGPRNHTPAVQDLFYSTTKPANNEGPDSNMPNSNAPHETRQLRACQTMSPPFTQTNTKCENPCNLLYRNLAGNTRGNKVPHTRSSRSWNSNLHKSPDPTHTTEPNRGDPNLPNEDLGMQTRERRPGKRRPSEPSPSQPPNVKPRLFCFGCMGEPTDI